MLDAALQALDAVPQPEFVPYNHNHNDDSFSMPTSSGPNSDDPPRRGSRQAAGNKGKTTTVRKTAAERQAAMAEKNRRAQKRFRERQKAKVQDIGSQLENMDSKLQNLRLENNHLKSKNGVLEQVLMVKDEHIRSLQDEQNVFDLGAFYIRSMGTIESGPSSRSGDLLTIETGATSGGTEDGSDGNNNNNNINNNNSNKISEVNATGSGEIVAREGTSSYSDQLMTGMNQPDSDGSVSRVMASINFDVQAIKTMPAKMVLDSWKKFVQELGIILVQVDEAELTNNFEQKMRVISELCRALEQMGSFCMHTAVLHPTNMQHLMASTLDGGHSGANAADNRRWAEIANSLDLTGDQMSQIIALRDFYVKRMSKVMEQRRAALQNLQTLMVPGQISALQNAIQQTLRVNRVTKQLKSNLQEEHLAALEFLGTIMKCVFTPLQKARAIVRSYPFYPDLYQIAVALDTGRRQRAAAAAADDS
jgi:hypothetical protein